MEASDGNHVDIRLAHPVHVLVGVVENCLRLPQRRNDETLSRVDRLLLVVRQYILRVARVAATGTMEHEVALKLEYDARWSMQTLLERSAPPYANFTLDTGRDLREAIPEPQDAPGTAKFRDEKYRRRIDRVDRRRRAAMNRRNASKTRTDK